MLIRKLADEAIYLKENFVRSWWLADQIAASQGFNQFNFTDEGYVSVNHFTRKKKTT